ncbi:MAG: Rieske (2Fe-2S) protein, partial [Pseudomonadota bacterium]
LVALTILFAIAATSHDFWLSFLTPPVWKRLHMGVYAGYAAVVLHVALGPLQSGHDPAFTVVFFAAVTAVSTLHFVAAMRDRREEAEIEKGSGLPDGTPWIKAGKVNDIVDKRAMIVSLPDEERVAIFRNGNTLSAVHNVCAHQNGPLGEGKIVAGCITCPWHGFQYRPEDGCSPPPFKEKIPTYRLRLDGETIYLDPRPLAPGTYVEPTPIGVAT